MQQIYGSFGGFPENSAWSLGWCHIVTPVETLGQLNGKPSVRGWNLMVSWFGGPRWFWIVGIPFKRIETG